MLSEDAPQSLAHIGEAIDAEDPVRVEKTAHKLKGSLIPFCAADAFEAVATLEEISHSGRLWVGLKKCFERVFEIHLT